MPVTNSKQARIELTDQQYITLSVLFDVAAQQKLSPSSVYIEETNLPGVIAVGSQFGFALVHPDGTYHHVGAKERTFTGERISSKK
jgi:hypothetical protein